MAAAVNGADRDAEMLDELDSYALSDFLLFSQETYFRLFELYNRAIWPLQVLLLGLGGIALYLLRRRGCARVAWGLLALVWAWVAWAFHLERYATINLAAPYFAALFGLEAVLLLAIGTAAGRLRASEASAPIAGTAVVVYAVVLHPLTGLLAGRTWPQLAYFGAAPDPTAIATLGMLLFAGGPLRVVLLVPAAAWCVISALTSYAMESVEGVAPAIFAATAILLSFRRPTRPAMDSEPGKAGRPGS